LLSQAFNEKVFAVRGSAEFFYRVINTHVIRQELILVLGIIDDTIDFGDFIPSFIHF
jgi:hypothetical protein